SMASTKSATPSQANIFAHSWAMAATMASSANAAPEAVNRCTRKTSARASAGRSWIVDIAALNCPRRSEPEVQQKTSLSSNGNTTLASPGVRRYQGVMERHVAEVAVVGGGPAGLTAALALAKTGADIVLFAPPAPADRRTTALLDGSVALLKDLGVW